MTIYYVDGKAIYTEYKVTDSKETAAGQPYFSVDLNNFGHSLNQIKEVDIRL